MNITYWGYLLIVVGLSVWFFRAWRHREPAWKSARDVLEEIVRTGTSKWFDDFLYVRNRDSEVEVFRKRALHIVEADPEGFRSVSAEGRQELRVVLEEMDRKFGSIDPGRR